MAKYLFCVIPSLGHLNPTLSIASELKKRGHIVGYASGENVKFSVENEGFEFFQVGPQGIKKDSSEYFKKVVKHSGLKSNYYLFKTLLHSNRQTIDGLKEVVREFKPDVLVVDSLTFAGGEIAELFNIKWATTSVAPGLIPTKDAPPFTSWGLPPSKRLSVKIIYNIIRLIQRLFFSIFDSEFNQIRFSLGLPPIKCGIINTTFSPYLFLILSCEGFEYKRSDWPPQAHLLGPSPWGKTIDDTTAFDWIDKLPLDKPLIYVTLGTFQVFRSLKFFQIVIDALKDEPYEIVMGVGHLVDLQELKNTPANFRVESFVPHSKILPRASAVIHHGGFGIAQDTIYNGLPSVVVPVGQGLYEYARRCTVAGVSISIGYHKLTAKRLKYAVQQILEDKTFKANAEKLREIFMNTNAGKTGADLLERLAKEQKPIYRSHFKDPSLK